MDTASGEFPFASPIKEAVTSTLFGSPVHDSIMSSPMTNPCTPPFIYSPTRLPKLNTDSQFEYHAQGDPPRKRGRKSLHSLYPDLVPTVLDMVTQRGTLT